MKNATEEGEKRKRGGAAELWVVSQAGGVEVTAGCCCSHQTVSLLGYRAAAPPTRLDK